MPSGRLKNLREIDKWSSLSYSTSGRRILVTLEFELHLYIWAVLNSGLSTVVPGDIVPSINIHT